MTTRIPIHINEKQTFSLHQSISKCISTPIGIADFLNKKKGLRVEAFAEIAPLIDFTHKIELIVILPNITCSDAFRLQIFKNSFIEYFDAKKCYKINFISESEAIAAFLLTKNEIIGKTIVINGQEDNIVCHELLIEKTFFNHNSTIQIPSFQKISDFLQIKISDTILLAHLSEVEVVNYYKQKDTDENDSTYVTNLKPLTFGVLKKKLKNWVEKSFYKIREKSESQWAFVGMYAQCPILMLEIMNYLKDITLLEIGQSVNIFLEGALVWNTSIYPILNAPLSIRVYNTNEEVFDNLIFEKDSSFEKYHAITYLEVPCIFPVSDEIYFPTFVYKDFLIKQNQFELSKNLRSEKSFLAASQNWKWVYFGAAIDGCQHLIGYAKDVTGKESFFNLGKIENLVKKVGTVNQSNSVEPVIESENVEHQSEQDKWLEPLLFDICVVDSNIWLEVGATVTIKDKQTGKYKTKTLGAYHECLKRLNEIFNLKNRKIILLNSCHGEIKRKSKESTDEKLKIVAREAERLAFEFQQKYFTLEIPDVGASTSREYADRMIVQYVENQARQGKNVMVIVNDRELNMKTFATLKRVQKTKPQIRFSVLDGTAFKQTIEELNNNFKGTNMQS